MSRRTVVIQSTPSRAGVVARGLGSLVALLVLGAGIPLMLSRFVGWPLPSSDFSPGSALEDFRRTGVAEGTVIKALALIVWLAWARLAAGIAVELVARLAHRQPREIRLLGSGQRSANRLIGAVLLMVSSFAGARGVGAAPLGATGSLPETRSALAASTVVRPVDDQRVVVRDVTSGAVTTSATWSSPRTDSGSATWTVQRNDSLWGIAESALGDGLRWREVIEANIGREVAPGVIFTSDTDSIHPGWVLALPATMQVPATSVPGGQRTITVDHGDTLSEIAATEFGDSTQWTSLWEANQGRQFGDRTFDDPSLIVPGWELIVPDDPSALETSPTPAPEPSRQPTTPDVVPTRTPRPGPTAVESALPSTAQTPAADQRSAPVERRLDRADVVADDADVPTQPQCAPVIEDASASPDETSTESTDSFGPLALIPAGVGGSLLAGGVLSLVASRRRRQLQQARRDAMADAVPDNLIDASRQLAALAAPERLARLDAALRAASSQLADLSERAAVVAALVDPTGTIELAISPGVNGVPLPPFTGDGTRWLLTADVATSAIAPTARRFAAFPNPGMVQLGRSMGCDVFVDVEAVGLLTIDGAESGNVMRAVVAGLAVSPFAELARLIRIGNRQEMVIGRSESVDDLDAALDLAADAVAPILARLEAHDTSAVLRMKSAGEPWEPLVIAAHAEAVSEQALDVLAEMTSPAGRGLGVITDVAGVNSTWCLVETPTGWVLDPLGWPVEPIGLTEPAARVLVDLADHAARALQVPVAISDSAFGDVVVAEGDPTTPVRPAVAWELMVRVIGPVDAVNGSGAQAVFEKSKSLELLTWLTEHRRNATRTGARSALWDNEVRDATFANVVSDARRSLARLQPSEPGADEWVGRTLTEQMTLHPLVVSDLDVVRDAIDRSRTLGDVEAMKVLRPAVELVRGVPFAGVAYLWADAEALGSNAALLAITVTGHFADRALRVGDVDAALWATGLGLVALPGHEELIGLRLRAHACRGDLVGLRQEWDQYERVLEADPWLDSEPSSTLVELRTTLIERLRTR